MQKEQLKGMAKVGYLCRIGGPLSTTHIPGREKLTSWFGGSFEGERILKAAGCASPRGRQAYRGHLDAWRERGEADHGARGNKWMRKHVG